MKRNWIILAVGVVIMIAIRAIIPPVRPEAVIASEISQHSGSGFVRSIDWYHRSLLFETDNGSQKPYWPLCDAQSIPVWQGEHCEFNFRWTSGANYTQEHGTGCYSIDWVKHLPPDSR